MRHPTRFLEPCTVIPAPHGETFTAAAPHFRALQRRPFARHACCRRLPRDYRPTREQLGSCDSTATSRHNIVAHWTHYVLQSRSNVPALLHRNHTVATKMPPQIKSDLNRSGWETTDFPSVCEKCLPDNPYVQMLKEDHGAVSFSLRTATVYSVLMCCRNARSAHDRSPSSAGKPTAPRDRSEPTSA